MRLYLLHREKKDYVKGKKGDIIVDEEEGLVGANKTTEESVDLLQYILPTP